MIFYDILWYSNFKHVYSTSREGCKQPTLASHVSSSVSAFTSLMCIASVASLGGRMSATNLLIAPFNKPLSICQSKVFRSFKHVWMLKGWMIGQWLSVFSWFYDVSPCFTIFYVALPWSCDHREHATKDCRKARLSGWGVKSYKSIGQSTRPERERCDGSLPAAAGEVTGSRAWQPKSPAEQCWGTSFTLIIVFHLWNLAMHRQSFWIILILFCYQCSLPLLP